MKGSASIEWLLAARTPSIRYLTRRHLLGCPEGDDEVQSARREMTAAGPIPAILSGQTPAGHWAGERSYYTPKYTSTHWSLLLLTELAIDPADPHLLRGGRFMLATTRDELERANEQSTTGLTCFWGNVLRYALHGGFAEDSRVQAMVRYLTRNALEGGWRCPHNNNWPCAWGAARALWGLGALPEKLGSSQVDSAIQAGLVFLLETHHLIPADYPPTDRVHTVWSRLNFPLFYQADVLFVLRVLGEVGALKHPGAQPALEWLAGRRQNNGHWRGASPFRGRTWKGLADREETDRWVSLQAQIVLRQAGAI
jgi:hypothetical protein